ncbi:TetR/AcrR family transcriptional regulator [Paenibacillus sp. Y412MC10]|uniref:TetR/AcrR family transcriptional regulator n=1 Tax=Geobacillus sp. (strain Y412MC10) TaxID=481743 RepID=UPI0011A0546A|nr:TetR/AcrR family transcriptional regulator [Paenibacillus sp. Y412MC10]
MTKIRNPRNPGRPKAAADQIPIQETILWTASKMFMENGYESVSLQQIAKACQVTKASIYYHFTSKPELFKIAVTTILDKAYASTHRFLQEADTLETGLIRVAEAKIAKPHAEMETMMREAEPFLSKEQMAAIREAEQRIHEVLADQIHQAMQSGELREGNALLMAQAFSAMLMLGNREDTRSGYASSRDMAVDIVDLFLHGAVRPANENVDV